MDYYRARGIAAAGIMAQNTASHALDRHSVRHFFREISMGKIFLVVPDAPMEDVAQLKAKRTLSGAGIRLGVLDNTKGNADHLLNFIIEGVKNKFKVDSVVMTRKASSSGPATDTILDQLAREADLVVSAMAD